MLRYLRVRVAADLFENEINSKKKQNYLNDFTVTYSDIGLLELHLQCLFNNKNYVFTPNNICV